MYTQSVRRRNRSKWIEYDVASPYARRVLAFLHRAGETAYWKSYINRRERRQSRAMARRYVD